MPWKNLSVQRVRTTTGWNKLSAGSENPAPPSSSGDSGGGVPVPVGFVHPGVVYSQAQINTVKNELTAGNATRTARYNNMVASTAESGANTGKAFSALNWVPTPISVVGRGSSGDPSQGDKDLQNDATAALVMALMWVYKADRARASKASEILNAWSSTITEILYSVTPDWSDGKLLAGWVGTRFARAAELLRYSGYVPASGEVACNFVAVENMFKNVFAPKLTIGHSGGGANWLASFCDSLIQMGVFCNDSNLYSAGIDMWRGTTPAMIYLSTDVNRWPTLAAAKMPHSPVNTQYDRSTTTVASMTTYWSSPNVAAPWPSGLEGETGRDFHHMAMGFAAMGNGAETAWHQGDDLWGEQQSRIIAGCELNTKFIYEVVINGNTGVSPAPKPPGWPFSQAPKYYMTSFQRATWEMIYNHYAGRKLLSLPNTLALLNAYVRNNNWDIDLHAVCEELTSRGTP